MRELKFRAWAFYGIPLDAPHYSEKYNLDRFFEDHDEYCDEQCYEQYICTTDEGTELYEGDIIRWLNSKGREITAPIVWDDRALCYMAGGYMLGGLMDAGVKVVGNTHNDLKLLEAKE